MIARLTGTLVEKSPSRVIVEVAGVGYDCSCRCPPSTASAMPAPRDAAGPHARPRGHDCALWFCEPAPEQDLSNGSSRSAGRTEACARRALGHRAGGADPRDPHAGRRAADAIPGIGKKTAERIGLELKDRLPAVASVAEPAPADRRRAINCATICCQRWSISVISGRRREGRREVLQRSAGGALRGRAQGCPAWADEGLT